MQKSFYRLLVTFSIRGFENNASFSSYAGLLTWNAIVAFLEQCVAKLVYVVLLLYVHVILSPASYW